MPGAMLARAEVRAALDEILLPTNNIELGEPRLRLPHLANNMTVYESVPVTLSQSDSMSSHWSTSKRSATVRSVAPPCPG